MNKELRRAELAARIKASFSSSELSEDLKLFTRIMNEVYYWQREDGPIGTLDSIHVRTQNNQEAVSR